MALLIIFLVSTIVFVRTLSSLFDKYGLTSFGSWMFAISFVISILSGLKLFGIYDITLLIK